MKRITMDKLYYLENTLRRYDKIYVPSFGICYYIGFEIRKLFGADILHLDVSLELPTNFFVWNGDMFFEVGEDSTITLTELNYDFNGITIIECDNDIAVIKETVN